MVDFLVAKGVAVDVKNNAGETALEKARSIIDKKAGKNPQSDLISSEEDYRDVEDLLVNAVKQSSQRVQ